MSVGGDGIVNNAPLVEVSRPAWENLRFIPRRFRAGGRLEISDSVGIRSTRLTTCVLCGGLIVDDDSTSEHPLPQWLHRYVGSVGDTKATAFYVSSNLQPTWRQLCLDAHRECNRIFARKVEDPAISGIKCMVEGKRVTSTQIDAVFDWLDKVKSASAHMAVALHGHGIQIEYDEICFPNRRIGAFDRLAIIFRVTDLGPDLNLWECLNEGFLSTPSAIALKIRNLIIVYASNNYLLSSAFGLGSIVMQDGSASYICGTGDFAPGFGIRDCRILGAKILAQPMRRQHIKEGAIDRSHALQANGDGKIYEFLGSRWQRVKSSEFHDLPKYNSEIGLALASLETIEWIIVSKELDYQRYGTPESYFIKSLPVLQAERRVLIELISRQIKLIPSS